MSGQWFTLAWPIGLIVLSNIIYHVCSKSIPASLNIFASLTVTYAVSAVMSLVMFFASSGGHSLAEEYRHLNWSSFVLGLALVFMEFGVICMYKSGWEIKSGQLAYSSLLTIVLALIGYFAYSEKITAANALGMAMCLAGLYFILK